MTRTVNTANGTLDIRSDSDGLVYVFAGRMDSRLTSRVWADALARARGGAARNIRVDASCVSYLDGSGAALLNSLRKVSADGKGRFEISGLSERLSRILELHRGNGEPPAHEAKPGFVDRTGLLARAFLADLREQVAFVGECSRALAYALRHPRSLRWKDVLHSCELVGADGVPIVALIGYLMGLILSFQSAITLDRFGATIFVPNMLGLAMFREMGPLVTCILLAGRSGSAFAAEIGTMKVNEEIDALDTMGLAPVRFLVVPKVLATVAMVPILTMFFNFVSLFGGATVMLAMGYPLPVFTQRVFMNVGFNDFWGGMAKALVFGLLVSAVGCMRGLKTRAGAGAVGESTTSAVVSGLVLIAVADGLFAVAFYILGW